MFWVWITTGTAEALLIMISGKVLGLGLIEVPLMLITLAVGDPVVGRKRLKGTDSTKVPLTEPGKNELVLSSRMTPGSPLRGAVAGHTADRRYVSNSCENVSDKPYCPAAEAAAASKSN